MRYVASELIGGNIAGLLFHPCSFKKMLHDGWPVAITVVGVPAEIKDRINLTQVC